MARLPWMSSPRERFARQVLRAARASHQFSAIRYDPADFAIVVQGHGSGEQGGQGRIFLGNTFQETRGMGRRERAQRIRALVEIVARDRPEVNDWQQVRARLRPVVRGVTFGLGVGDDPSSATLSRPLLPYLTERVVVDEPTSMFYVTQARLPQWGVTEAEVFAAARENLLPLAAGPPPREPGQPATVLRFVDTGDGYFTSMLLVPGFLAGLADRVGGRPVAFVPDRDTLFVAADDPGLAALFPLAEQEYQQATRGLSPAAYTVDAGGQVVPYDPPPDAPDLARLAHRARTLLAHGEYGAQKHALDARFERDGVDVFVASLMVLGRADGSVFSLAVWSQNVDTLLPEADLVAFQPDATDAGSVGGAAVLTDAGAMADAGVGQADAASVLTVPFDVVAREAVLVAEPDHNPPRFRVAGWPREEVLARLRPHAVPL